MRQVTLFLSLVVFSLKLSAQREVQKELEGMTFYDTAKTKVHEAFEYKLKYRLMVNPKTGDLVEDQRPIVIKNGRYIKYRPNGTIECTGFYRENEACGIWEYKDVTGKKTIKTENKGGDCLFE